MRFDAGPGAGNVIVSARVRSEDLIREKSNERGVPDIVTQKASVQVTIESPSGVQVVTKSVVLPRPGADAAPIGFTLAAPVEPGEWRCRVTNTGPTEIECNAKFTFPRDPLRVEETRIGVRTLNQAFAQAVDAIGLHVKVDAGRATITADRALFAIVGVDPPNLSFPAKAGNDFNMATLAVKAGASSGFPALRVLIEFETVGETEISFGPIDLADITESTLELTLQLRVERERIVPRPLLKARIGTELTNWAKAGDLVLRAFGTSVDEIIADNIDSLQANLSSSAYLDPVGTYLTEALLQLAHRGHRFHSLTWDEAGPSFVVEHYDPDAAPVDGDDGRVIDDNPSLPDDGNDFLRPVEPPSAEFRAALDRLQSIDTIVVLMMENRSFDHMLGHHSLPGGTLVEGKPQEGKVDGLAGTERNSAPGNISTGINGLPSRFFWWSPAHGHADALAQVDNGQMSGFLASYIARFPSVSVADDNPERLTPLSHYTAGMLPTYDALTRHHVVCDRWFAAFPGPTQPNRFCALAGRTPILENMPFSDPLVGHLPDETLFDRLTAHNVNWCYYESDLAFLRFFDRYRLDDKRVIPFVDPHEGFVARAKDGRLPPVVFIDPNFIDVPPIRTANDDLAPADVARGQDLVALIHDTLLDSPQWSSCMLIVTYDEHGGFFDHVAPPGTDAAPAEIARVHPKGPRYLGVRVPAFVVSPLVADGGVTHRLFDHTSIGWTILLRFVGPDARPLSERMARTNHLGYVVEPTTVKDTPRIGPTPPKPKGIPNEEAPENRQLPRLTGPPLVDFDEAVRWFGRPVISR